MGSSLEWRETYGHVHMSFNLILFSGLSNTCVTKMKSKNQIHKNLIFSGLLLSTITGIVGVEIRKMSVPSEVESGTVPHVILDWDYDLAASESNQVDVKWFFREDPQPFYQWLPGRPPQAIGDLFKNRIDLTHAVEGGDRFRKHRALKILNPTTELSGTYRCKVSSFVDEDFMQRRMIVYAPPWEVNLIYTRPDSNHINLTCSAFGVYPKPELLLSWGPGRDQRGETTTLTIEREGLFDISVTKILKEALLQPEAIFQCLLTIPETTFIRREETMYFPGKVLPQITSSRSSTIDGAAPILLIVLTLTIPLFN